MGVASSSANLLELLEHQAPTAFLLAGGALLGSTTLKGIGWFTGIAAPRILIAVLALFGLTAAFLGLAGLYPSLRDRTPRLARTALAVVAVAGIAVVGVVGWVIVTMLVGMFPWLSAPASPPAALFLSLVATIGLGAILFGVTCVRAAAPSRAVGGFLLGFAGTWVALIAVDFALGPAVPNWLYLLIYGGQPVALLSTGYVLRTRAVSAGHEMPTGEVRLG